VIEGHSTIYAKLVSCNENGVNGAWQAQRRLTKHAAHSSYHWRTSRELSSTTHTLTREHHTHDCSAAKHWPNINREWLVSYAIPRGTTGEFKAAAITTLARWFTDTMFMVLLILGRLLS
jgi:hypothetical protein